ncbi:MAG: hypothetical protein R3F62_13540 [Planctomycetota bacterium]
MTDLDPDAFDDVLALLHTTELAVPTTLSAPAPSAPTAQDPWVRDADEAWSLALAFLGDEEAAREALVEGFARLDATPPAPAALEDTLAALCPALLEVARLLEKGGAAPEPRGAALPAETRLALLLRAAFPGAALVEADPALLERALVGAFPQPTHPQGERLCALLAQEALGSLDPADGRELARLRARHPASAALIQVRYQETVEVPLAVLGDVEGLQEEVARRRAQATERAANVSALQLQTRIHCAYCHDRLLRAEAAFCASCLAPHHADCFARHGRCSAPGCAETRLVHPHATPRRRPWLPWLVATVVAGGAAAWGLWPRSELEGATATQLAQRTEVDPALLREARALTEATRAARAARDRELAELRERLNAQSISLDFPNTTVREGLEFLRQITALNITVTQEARELLDAEATPVALVMQDVGALDALALILSAGHGDLGYRLDTGAVVVEVLDGASAPLELEAYPVGDLLTGAALAHGGVRFNDPDQLIVILERALPPEDSGSLDVGQETLVVRKSARVHRALKELLQLLRGNAPPHEPPAWHAELTRALEQPVTLDLHERPVGEVLAALREATPVDLVASTAVDVSLPVSLTLTGLPLKDALRLLVEQCGLTWRLSHGVVLLVPAGESLPRAELRFALYDVHDLRTWLADGALQETLLNAVGEDAWDEPANLLTVGEHLLVFQTDAQHEAVSQALAELRVSRARNQPRAR